VPSTDKAKRAEQRRRQRAKRTAEKVEAERKADAARHADVRAIESPKPDTTRPAIRGFDPEAEWGGLIGDGSTNWHDKGYDGEPYRDVAALSAGFPSYWDDGCPYQGDERRWVIYCLRQKWHIPVVKIGGGGAYGWHHYQRIAEARGVVIHDRLMSAPPDVLRLARWLRDGRAAYAFDMDRARISAALIRLRDMGIYRPWPVNRIQ
jgi:hypothetical protein